MLTSMLTHKPSRRTLLASHASLVTKWKWILTFNYSFIRMKVNPKMFIVCTEMNFEAIFVRTAFLPDVNNKSFCSVIWMHFTKKTWVDLILVDRGQILAKIEIKQIIIESCGSYNFDEKLTKKSFYRKKGNFYFCVVFCCSVSILSCFCDVFS